MAKTGTDVLKAAGILFVRAFAVLVVIVTIVAAQPQDKTIGKQQTNNSPGGGHSNSPTGIGGPDALGYGWIDSDEPGGPTVQFFDIRFVGTRITVLTSGTFDDGYATTALPWPFPFYGTSYSAINLCTNGFVNFGAGSTEFSNGSIPSVAVPNNAIYAFWDDLDLRFRGKLFFYNDVANGRYIIQYDSVPRFNAGGAAGETDTLTFQIMLKPNGEIVLNYRKMFTTNPAHLNLATIGIENSDGTVGLQVVNNAVYMHDFLTINFTRSSQWQGCGGPSLITTKLCWIPALRPGDSAIVDYFQPLSPLRLYVGAGELHENSAEGCTYNGLIGGLAIIDTLTKVDTFSDQCFLRGTFAIERSMTIDASGLFDYQSNDSTRIPGNLLFVSTGSLRIDGTKTPKFVVGGNWLRSSNSVFTHGKSKVVFTGNGVLSRNFYDLLINAGSAMTTVGNISVENQIDVRDSLGLRRQDNLLIAKGDTAAFIGSGLVRRGTIQRTIHPSESGRYRYESDSTYLHFSAPGNPLRADITTFPDSTIPSQNFVQFGGEVVRYPGTNSIRVIGEINPYKRWAIGVPRLSPNAPPQLVKRVYNITTFGSAGDTMATLSLRYDDDELQPGMDENQLTLFYLNLPPAPNQIRATVRAYLEGPFDGAASMTNTLKTGGTLASHFPAGLPIPAQAVDSITIEIRETPGGVAADSIHMPERIAEETASLNGGQRPEDIENVAVTLKTSQPAWLLTDGGIKSFYDTLKSYVEFDTSTASNNWYIVVRHRNHLAIMTRLAQTLTNTDATLYDFSTSQLQAYGTNPMKLKGTKYCLYTGDANASGIVSAADANAVFGLLNAVGYNNNDVNLSGIVTAADANAIFGNLNAASQFTLPTRSQEPSSEIKDLAPRSAEPAKEN